MLISAFSRSLSGGLAAKRLRNSSSLRSTYSRTRRSKSPSDNLSRIHRVLGIGRVRPRVGILLQAVETCVPFEVFERPEFLRLCQAGRVQRMLNELLANFFDEVRRNATAVVIDPVAAKQTLIASQLFHPLCVPPRCATREC